MSTTKVGKDTSLQEEGSLFQTFRDLLKQREALDRQIRRLQGKLLRIASKKAAVTSKNRKVYVPRMENDTILKDAIRSSMTPGKKMTMKQVLGALGRKKLYSTQSGYFYTMVNNKLNRDPRVKKVSRGVFVLRKTGQRKKAS